MIYKYIVCCVSFYFVALDVSLGFYFLLCVCYVNPAYGCQIEINCVVCGRKSLRTNVPADTPKQYYLRSVAIPFTDALKEQLETRFSRDDTSPIAALLQLVPRILSTKSTDDLVDKLSFYTYQQVCGVK